MKKKKSKDGSSENMLEIDLLIVDIDTTLGANKFAPGIWHTQVELLILSHHFYKSSACLDGVDVLVALAATRVDAYVSEGDFPCLARLITGVGNFHTLNFILGILIENGQLDLLLQKLSAAADANRDTADAVRGFRMAVLTSLKHFNPNDLDAFAMVCIFHVISCMIFSEHFGLQSFLGVRTNDWIYVGLSNFWAYIIIFKYSSHDHLNEFTE